MLTNKYQRAARTSFPTIRYTAIVTLALGTGQAPPVFSQTTPNWGASTSQAPAASTTTKASPWGAPATAAPAAISPASHLPAKSNRTVATAETMPPKLAEVLKHPDSEAVTLTNGQTTTVREIRAEAQSRQAIIAALKTGTVPTGRKRVVLGTARSPQRDELVNASSSLKELSRREAAAQWASPSATADAPPPKRETPSAWGAPSSTSELTAQTSQVSRYTGPGAPTTLHSGVGTSTLPKTGSASAARFAKPPATSVSQQPAAVFTEQNLPPGIALVNGHANAVQFTPGGLYTVIGTGFGSAAGTVDLIGTNLPGGRLELQVTQWRDRQLQVQLHEPLAGVADQAVMLRVTTHAGALLMKPVQFYATRQTLTLSGGDLDLSQAFDLKLGNPNDWDNTATLSDAIVRTKSGNNISCPSIGQDSLRTKFPSGWALVDVSVSTWLPAQSDSNKDFFGHGGDTVVSGSYSITQVPAGLTNQTFNANWGVLRSHSTDGFKLIPQFTGNDFGWSGNDGCVSMYEVSLTVVGPAGLRPF